VVLIVNAVYRSRLPEAMNERQALFATDELKHLPILRYKVNLPTQCSREGLNYALGLMDNDMKRDGNEKIRPWSSKSVPLFNDWGTRRVWNGCRGFLLKATRLSSQRGVVLP
jgi:hypothetical protein